MTEADSNYKHRRAGQRLPFKRQVRLKSPSAGDLDLEGVNYSRSGIAVQSFRQLPAGEQVKLVLPVGDDDPSELEVAGEIVHNTLQGNGFTIGIRFLEQIDTQFNSD